MTEVADVLVLGLLRSVLVFPDENMGKDFSAIVTDAQIAICLIESSGAFLDLPALKEPKRARLLGDAADQPAVSLVRALLRIRVLVDVGGFLWHSCLSSPSIVVVAFLSVKGIFVPA